MKESVGQRYTNIEQMVNLTNGTQVEISCLNP